MLNLKPTILISIEVKSRELLSKCLLAHELIKRGFRVYLGSTLAIYHVARSIEKSIILHKSTWKNRSELLKSHGHIFTFLDEEGGITISRHYLKEFCKNRYSSVSKKNTDIIFLPNLFFLRQIKRNLGLKANGVKFFVTGWPRIDLWRKKYQFLYLPRINEIRKKYGRFFFFISSFGMSDLKTFKELINSEPKNYHKTIRFKYNSLLKYIDLFKKLSILMKQDEKIIIRPHFNESLTSWKKIFKDYPNIKVIREGEVDPWIYAADSLIQFGSTTVTQAALNNKNCIQYKVINKKGVTDTPSYELCANSKSPEEMYSLLKQNKNNIKLKKKAQEYLKKYMFYEKNETSTIKLVRELKNIKIDPIKQLNLNFFNKFIYNLYYVKIFIHSFLSKLKFFPIGSVNILDKLEGGIQEKQIKNIFRLFEKNNQFTSGIKINIILKDLFCIEKN